MLHTKNTIIRKCLSTVIRLVFHLNLRIGLIRQMRKESQHFARCGGFSPGITVSLHREFRPGEFGIAHN